MKTFFIVFIINFFIINYLRLLNFEVIIQIKHIAITLGVHTYTHIYFLPNYSSSSQPTDMKPAIRTTPEIWRVL